MEPLLIAILVGLLVYVAAVALIPKRLLQRHDDVTKNKLCMLEAESASYYSGEDQLSILREQMKHTSLIGRAFFLLPGASSAYPKIVKAGLEKKLDIFLLSMVLVFAANSYLLKQIGIFAIILALVATLLIGRWIVLRAIRKRNEAFLNVFPDALDMIVRSLRSGYPMNATVRMVSENMQEPVAREFKQLADETSYGSTLVDALKRLADRIDEPDIRFFVVVLAVQQDVGGNLAEVLGNLSAIIRKRKHLRLKIKALTSEGVAAAWVLGMLPLFEFIMIHIFTPTHLEPFFTTHAGNVLLATAIGIVLFGMMIVRKMINIDV